MRITTPCLTLVLLVSLDALAQETDPETGLIVAEGWKEVKANCTTCHSARLVTQNRGSRSHWEYLVRWMQKTQGLWDLPPERESAILDYLADHYGPKEGTRRARLPPDKLPDNPYKAF